MGNCSQVNNTTIKGTSAVTYDSTPLPCTDVNTCDGLNTILSKFNAIMCDVKANVDIITEDVINLTEDVMVITEDITNINNQLDICCPTTTTTTTLPPTTTTTTTVEPTTTTTTSSSSTSTTTSTSTSTTTSTSSTTTTTTTFPPLQLCIEYEVSGANTFVNWTDCDGNPQSYELTELQIYIHDESPFSNKKRILLSSSVFLGVVSGIILDLLYPLQIDVIYQLFAFICGIILYIVLKNDLPDRHEGKPVFFFLGIAAFCMILMLGKLIEVYL